MLDNDCYTMTVIVPPRINHCDYRQVRLPVQRRPGGHRGIRVTVTDTCESMSNQPEVIRMTILGYINEFKFYHFLTPFDNAQ
jgi:hypothetical protein